MHSLILRLLVVKLGHYLWLGLDTTSGQACRLLVVKVRPVGLRIDVVLAAHIGVLGADEITVFILLHFLCDDGLELAVRDCVVDVLVASGIPERLGRGYTQDAG